MAGEAGAKSLSGAKFPGYDGGIGALFQPCKAIFGMHRQVGVAQPAKDGLMHRGLLIRHLVMPNNAGGSEKIMAWIAERLSKDTYAYIMAQYTPVYKAYDYPEISRRITREAYAKVVTRASEVELTNLDDQGYGWLKR